MTGIKVYEESVPDDFVKQGLAEMVKMIEEMLDIANETNNPKKALTIFLEKLDINGVVKRLPFDFSRENRIVKVAIGFTCKKTGKTNLVNLMKTAKNLLLKKEKASDCCDEELARITASVKRMVTLAYKTERPSSVLLSFNEHLEDINMILPLTLSRLGILK